MLNEAFHDVDANLSRMCEESEGKIHSGCTAVTAFVRLEDATGKQSFRPQPPSPPATTPTVESPTQQQQPDGDDSSSDVESGVDSPAETDAKPKKKPKTSTRLKNAIKSLGSGSSLSPKPSSQNLSRKPSTETVNAVPIFVPPANVRRVLYSANVGDARGVLCRAGKAVRLTYDHKGSDKQEAKRITDAGGFVMSGRVNGVLAVTRSLGDSSMKEFVVGAPYTTETELCDEDEFLILACDGVRFFFSSFLGCLIFKLSRISCGM